MLPRHFMSFQKSNLDVKYTYTKVTVEIKGLYYSSIISCQKWKSIIEMFKCTKTKIH